MQYEDPDPPGGSGADAAETIRGWYVRYLGREPDDSEIQIHLRNPNGLAAVLEVIRNSPEAKARTAPTPTPTGQPGGSTQRPSNMAGWQQWFSQLTQGKPYTPDTLKSLAPELEKMGAKVLTNAAGVAGKIQLPDGTIVDVIRSAGLGGKGWQWSTGTGGGGGGTGAGGAGFGSLREPYGEKFSYDEFSWDQPEMDAFNPNVPQVDPLELPDMPDLPEYVNPEGRFSFTQEDFFTDPSYGTRFQEGVDAIDASGASRGNLLTGGTLKALTKYGQDQASKEFQNAYARKAGAWQANTNDYGTKYGYQRANIIDPYNAKVGNLKSEWQSKKDLSDTSYNQQAGTYGINAAQYQNKYDRAKGTWGTNYGKALDEYKMRYGIWNDQQDRDFNNLYRLMQLGQASA